jgi:demethylmenaquinone methyltransferase/2-methoxy-6-polyprenyl-1,4-benzoquinol methylase
MDEDAVVKEQIDYYRKRAPEYDRTSSLTDDPLEPFGNEITEALDSFRPTGRVLEIASGTGNWTHLLLQHASSVTALDPSPEMHALARAKNGVDDRIRYVEADVFAWAPDAAYDVVFFANWLSHVPPSLFERFWGVVRKALAPGGRIFLVDEGGKVDREEDFIEPGGSIVRRPLSDGTTFEIVKVFWDPRELVARLHPLGWSLEAHASGPFFWAEAIPKD